MVTKKGAGIYRLPSLWVPPGEMAVKPGGAGVEKEVQRLF